MADEAAEGIVTVLAAGVALALLGGVGAVAVVAILRATKLTADGTVSLDGTNPADPAELAASYDRTLDEYSLARMIESEAGGLSSAGKIGVGWAAQNYARRVGKSLSTLLLRSTGAGNGYFGRQDQGRYAATSKDPTAASVGAALQVIGELTADPTNGADQWDSPWSYKDNVRTGETAAERAIRVAQQRQDAGKQMVLLEGVPERKLRFWRDVA